MTISTVITKGKRIYYIKDESGGVVFFSDSLEAAGTVMRFLLGKDLSPAACTAALNAMRDFDSKVEVQKERK